MTILFLFLVAFHVPGVHGLSFDDADIAAFLVVVAAADVCRPFHVLSPFPEKPDTFDFSETEPTVV